MKIIFLDIDGVLNYNNFKSETKTGSMFVSDKKMEILKKIIEETNAKIVLSSTWRKGWKDLDLGLPSCLASDFIELRDKFKEYELEFYDKTPILSYYMTRRGEEINLWLDKHKEVEGFVIIDDMSGRWLRPHSKHHLQTSVWKGLEEKHIKKIRELLELPINKNNTETEVE